jgi:hypothetical protein
MLFFRKFFTLPGPVELGWSKYDALECEEFSDNPKGKTWQDWHKAVKHMYPIKYFIIETLANWFLDKVWLPIKRPVSDMHYWLMSHLIPSRRYHMLDLRQPCDKQSIYNIDCYRYGWCDVPEKMLFAMFNLLGEYLNKEDVHDLSETYSQEEIDADETFKAQQAFLKEARLIYKWWSIDRKKDKAAYNIMQNLWYQARKSNSSEKDKYWAQMNKLDADFENKTDEMISRLMKIRRTLWS